MKGYIVRSSIFFVLLIVFIQNSTAQSWTRKTDFINGPSSSAYAFTIHDTIYVGNTGGLGFYQYDYLTDSWTPKANVPAALNDHSNAVGFAVDGKGYMLGGLRSPGVCVPDVWEYNPLTDTWLQKGDFPGGKRGAASCFVIGNKAYVGGGFDTIDIGGFSPIPKNDFWQYDPATDTWTPKATLPYASSYLLQPFAFSIGNKGYFSCGDRVRLSGGLYRDTDVNSTYEYDTLADSWAKKSDFPGAVRSGGVAFVVNNKAYCGTGIDDTSTSFSGSCYNDFYVYDAVADAWSPLATAPFANRTYAIAATVSTGKAFVGTGWDSPSSTVYYQDWWELSVPTTGTALATNRELKIACFPNPNNGLFSLILSSNGHENVEVKITNIMGEKVEGFTTDTNSETQLNLHVAPGIYFVTVVAAQMKYVDKIVVY
jgi:N-acetylneuraminic acid mutarotase